MKILALVSGGKDSCYAVTLCQRYGHEVVALGNLAPDPCLQRHDLDSWMFQTVGYLIVSAYTQCTGLPLFRAYTNGVAMSNGLSYSQSSGDEVEDLYRLIHYVKMQFPDLDAVCSGAIASDYQRLRVESVCTRLGLISFAPLWRRPQMELLDDMICNGIEAIIVKVAAEGLIPKKHLGQSLVVMKEHLIRLRDMYGCNICGEGGEYETLVLNAPTFKFGKIVIDRSNIMQEGNVVPIGILEIQSYHIEAKDTFQHAIKMEPIIVPADPVQGESQEDEVLDISTDQMEDVELTVSEAGMIYDFDVCLRQDVPQYRYTSGACLELLLKKLEMHLSRRDIFTSFKDIVFVHLFLKDMKTFGNVNDVYRRYLPVIDPPSRACVQLDIQHSCRLHVCAVKDRVPYWSRRVLHVQSMSSWAPCCIGPYSQATSVDDMTFVAGQLGLDPISMQFVESDWRWEVTNVLRHCQSVTVAIGGDMQRSVMKITVYLSSDFAATLTKTDRDELQRLMEHHWPLWHSTASATNKQDDATVDTYLKGPQMEVEIEPMVTIIVVPALPKSAKIEIQPILLNKSMQAIDVPKLESFEDTDIPADFSVTSDRVSGGKGHSPVVRCLSMAPVDQTVRSLWNTKVVYRQLGLGFIQMHLSNETSRLTSQEGVMEFGRCCGQCLNFCLNQYHLQMLSAEIWFDKTILNPETCQSLTNRIRLEVIDKDEQEQHWRCFPSEGVGIDPWLNDVIVVEVMAINVYRC